MKTSDKNRIESIGNKTKNYDNISDLISSEMLLVIEKRNDRNIQKI